jgi:hypothetical protein
MAAVNSLSCLLLLLGCTTTDDTGTRDLMKRGDYRELSDLSAAAHVLDNSC